MATFTGNGSGSGMYGYMHARVVVTRTDNSNGTTCSITVACYAVSDGGSSSFISGRASNNEACTTWSSYSSEKSVSSGGTTSMTSASFTVNRTKSSKTITCKAQIAGGGTGMYSGTSDTASVSVTIPALATYTVSYDQNLPSGVTTNATGMPSSQTKYHGTSITTSSAIPALANYVFKGWAESKTGSVAIASGSTATYSVNANKTYYAVWELGYTTPTISNVSVFRTTSASSTNTDNDGTYLRVTFDWTQDTRISGTTAPKVTISARLKGSTDSYTPCKSANASSGTSGSYAASMGFGSSTFSTDNSYDVKIEIVDQRSSKPSGNDGKTTADYTLSQSYFHMDWSPEGGVAIGKPAPSSKTFDVGIDANFDGDVNVEGTVTLKKTEFQLTRNETNCSSLGTTWAGSNGVCVTVSVIDAVSKVEIASNGTLAIATVPEGYRPRANVYSNCFGYNGLCTMRIESNGTVSIRNQSGAAKSVGTWFAATLTYYI